MFIAKHFLAGIVAASMFAAFALPAQAQTAAPAAGSPPPIKATKDETFDDWTLSCSRDADAPICAIGQVLNDSRTEQVMLVVEFVNSDGPQPVLQITAPLSVLLPEKVSVDVDGKDGGTMSFVWCEPMGCRAITSFDDDYMQKIRKGKTFNVKYVLLNKQEVSAPVSLKGVGAALDALAKKKKKS